MLGHANPDEDCIAAMVSFGLLVSKFDKHAFIYIDGKLQEQHHYLLNICKHNSIEVLRDRSAEVPVSEIDTIVVCDTPKPTMVAAPDAVAPLFADEARGESGVVVIEFDHHLAADSAYIGDADYALVTEASSACELVGYTAFKLSDRTELLAEYRIDDLFSRNFVLSVLTGIIGDSKMGKFLKSRRERRFYEIFSTMFNDLLTAQTTRAGNFSNKEEVFTELIRLSAEEEACYAYMTEHAAYSPSIGYVVLDEGESRAMTDRFDTETVVSVSRAIADSLAEKSGKLSLAGYYDATGGLVQFRVRRSRHFKSYDVRRIIELFDFSNGGGHEGAIGFRIDRDEIDDVRRFTARLIAGIERDIANP